MKEISYILLFDKDLITSSVFTLAIYKNQPESNIYRASSTHQALKLLDMVCEHEEGFNFQQEVCFIVDLNMISLEGYVFLISLEQHHFNCPVRVYVLNDERRPNSGSPSTEQYKIAGRLNKPIGFEEIERIMNDPSPKYFQKKLGAKQPLSFY